MTTLIDNDVEADRVVLESLEFEVPCQLLDNRHAAEPTRCEDAAEWVVQFKGHCAGVLVEVMVCAEHHEFIAEGGLGTCRVCRGIITLRDVVVRTERIKP